VTIGEVMAKKMTEVEWRTLDELRKYWDAMCMCDHVPIDTDDFKERLERYGYMRWRTVTRRDLAAMSFADELGFELGGLMCELTAKGRAAFETEPASI
jgi:hypothetical protein